MFLTYSTASIQILVANLRVSLAESFQLNGFEFIKDNENKGEFEGLKSELLKFIPSVRHGEPSGHIGSHVWFKQKGDF